MAVVFAVLTSNPGLLGCELRRLEGQVRVDGPGTPSRGAGSYSQGEVLMHRFPPGATLELCALSPPEGSEALVSLAGGATAGLASDENTQPFRFRRWLFAHDGPPVPLGPARAAFEAALPDYLRRLVQGETDSELLFLHFLAQLREVGRADDQRMPATDVARALHAAMARLDAALGGRGGGSAVVTDGQVLVALRGGERPLSYTVLEGSERCEACGLRGGLPETDAAVRAHRRRRSVAVASDVLRPQGWLALPPRTAVAVETDLQVRHVPAPQA